jgi:F-type H+-transporting ATPase subunit a
MHHELWFTRLLNDYLPGPANAVLGIVGWQAHNPQRPWVNYISMEILAALILVVVFAVLRGSLSMDKPGKLQHMMEAIWEFLNGEADQMVGHGSGKYVGLFATLFLFVLVGNLMGAIPTLESPTMYPSVTLGCAMIAFFYYNIVGISAVGIGKYLAHFAGPNLFMAPLMIPIEIVSHLARPLSLTIRLYANMLAGEQVTLVFLGLTYLVVPAMFMGLHVFVGFLQAYVFAALTMIYVGGAVAHEEEH